MQKQSYEIDFENWVIEHNVKVYTRLSDVLDNPPFEILAGKKVTYTNYYGVKFRGYTVLGFCERQNNIFTGTDTQRYIFLDKSSWWFPVSVESICLEP